MYCFCSHSLPNSSTTQNVSERVRDLFILMDRKLLTFIPGTITHHFFNNDKYFLPVRETSDIILRNLLEHDLTDSSNTLLGES